MKDWRRKIGSNAPDIAEIFIVAVIVSVIAYLVAT